MRMQWCDNTTATSYTPTDNPLLHIPTHGPMLHLSRHLLDLCLSITRQLLCLALRLPDQSLGLVLQLSRLVLCLSQSLLRFRLQCMIASSHVPVIDEAIALRHLCGEVHRVAAEEKIVLGSDGHGVAHEDTGVAAEGESHAAGDAVKESV